MNKPLDLLMEQPPLKQGAEPDWHAPAPLAPEKIHVPTWAWKSPIHELPAGTGAVTLTRHASLLAAVGACTIAPTRLTRTGKPPAGHRIQPGYYRIAVTPWWFHATCVSPLGDPDRLTGEDTVWIAHPTLHQLSQLRDAGSIAELTIIDSWTTRETTDLRAWADALSKVYAKITRAVVAAHPAGAPADCDCEPCTERADFHTQLDTSLAALRPDWTHAVKAQAAADTWDEAWSYTATGHPLLAMEGDRLTLIGTDVHEVLARAWPPFTYDETGLTPGTYAPEETP